MRLGYCFVPSAMLVFWAATAGQLHAAGSVRLELVTEARLPLGAQHEWLRRLGQVGIDNLRIRPARPADKVGIDVYGTKDRPLYLVTGKLISSTELVLPGGRYKPGEAARVAQWLEDLARLGPPDQRQSGSTAFRLGPGQFERVHDDLAQPLGFSTKGLGRGDVVRKIGRRLTLPLKIDPKLAAALDEDKIAEELSDLSCGTALAYTLRPRGLCLVPRETDGRGPVYVVTPSKPDLEAWPVGWVPEKSRHEVLPVLFEFLNVNVQGVSVAEALEVIGKRLKAPILMDHNALARHGIQPDKVPVSLPSRRTTYSLLLSKLLFQARLKSELRVDESGTPFLWVTTIKPM